MKYLITVITLINFVSCSVKHDDNSNKKSSIKELSINQDSDGDLISDLEEKEVGRSPKIANIPEIRVRFLQNYKITVNYLDLNSKKEGSFIIDTKIGGNSPDFKYRIGNLFLRDSSFKSAASIGKFSSHSHGEYFEHDLSWVKYPKLDEKFFQEKVLLHSKYFNEEQYEITNVRLELENSLKLKENTIFKQISNSELSFRFYNYETENYEIIHSQKIERNFISGVNEIVSVTIDNVNPKLISENFFKKGEFIISELSNYDIPTLKTNYKTLINSIKEKTIPVVLNTPLETSVNYVAAGNGIKFNQILETLYDKNFVIENEKLKSLNQFQSNLKDYTYLSEVKDQDKKGKWFVFTNRINKHFLDYEFKPNDVVSLSYILGRNLARQAEEKIFNYRDQIHSTGSYQTYALGNISPNSEVKFFLKPLLQTGETLKQTDTYIGNKDAKCYLSINDFKPMNQTFTFRKDLKEEISRIDLIVNNSNYRLVDLINDKKVKISWEKQGIALGIEDINKIHKIYPTDENFIAIRMHAYRKNHFDGVKLTKMSGRFKYYCPMNTVNFAGGNKLPISIESIKFNEWAAAVNWNVIKKGVRKDHVKMFSIAVTGIISNFYN